MKLALLICSSFSTFLLTQAKVLVLHQDRFEIGGPEFTVTNESGNETLYRIWKHVFRSPFTASIKETSTGLEVGRVQRESARLKTEFKYMVGGEDSYLEKKSFDINPFAQYSTVWRGDTIQIKGISSAFPQSLSNCVSLGSFADSRFTWYDSSKQKIATAVYDSHLLRKDEWKLDIETSSQQYPEPFFLATLTAIAQKEA